MNIEEFKNKLDKNGFGEYFDKLKPLLRNTIRLYQRASDERNIPLGQTKIGGKPDLPPDFSWVTETNTVETLQKGFLFFKRKRQVKITKPLSFIAQINLSEISSFDKDDLLPESGLLYFFYSSEQEAWGFELLDKNKFKVIYWNGDVSALKRIDYPHDLPDDSCYASCSVEIKSELSLPSYGHEVYQGLTDAEHDRFWELFPHDENINKLLGYADTIQNEMELECELVTNGIFCGNPTGYHTQKAKLLEPNAKKWRLLLQIDSNEENEMMWGDCGRLYFWIKIDDLLHMDFDKSWFSLQCS